MKINEVQPVGKFNLKFNSHLQFAAYYRPIAHYIVTETMVSRVEN